MPHELTPDKIMQVAVGFMSSKTLLSAIELGVFTELAKGPQDRESLHTRLDLHPRSARDFFDALVSPGMLQRNNGQYANTPEGDLFLDRVKSSYIGGLLEMANARLYGFWGTLTTALKTGEPQNEAKRGEDFFAAIYADPAKLKQFLSAMTGLSMGIAKAHAALPKGGVLIVCEAIIDDQRRQNTFGLLSSLTMLIEHKAGFEFTGADCSGWMRDAGFKETRVEPLCGPDSMVVGIK